MCERACLGFSYLSSFFIPLSVLPPAPLRTNMLTHGIIWHAFVYRSCTPSIRTLVSRLISWDTFVLRRISCPLSTRLLKNFFYLFYHRSLSLLFFFVPSISRFIDHYHHPHSCCFTLFIDFFSSPRSVLPSRVLFMSTLSFVYISASTGLTM